MAGFNLRRAYFVATRLFAEQCNGLEITPIQFAILEVIAQEESLPQKEIAERVGTAASVVVRPIRDLEQNGIVERLRDPADRRNHHLRLTGAGHQLRAALQPRIHAVEGQLLSPLQADERATLIDLLTRIIHSHPRTP
jgi:DNA-binding MarR family transcriptional regulator